MRDRYDMRKLVDKGEIAVIGAQHVPMGLGLVVEAKWRMRAFCRAHGRARIDDRLLCRSAQLVEQHIEAGGSRARADIDQILAVDALLVGGDEYGARDAAGGEPIVSLAQLG